MERHFRRGLEAALRTDAESFGRSKARSVMGSVVKALVLEAQRGKTAAIKLIFALLEEPEDEAGVAERGSEGTIREAPRVIAQEVSASSSQGSSEEFAPANAGETPAVPGRAGGEAPWDWTESGVWNARDPEGAEPVPEEPARLRANRQGDAEEIRRRHEAALRVNQMVVRFEEDTREARARHEAEPPGSPARVEQWQASIEALAPREGQSEEEAVVRRRLLHIAEAALAEEEGHAAALRDPGVGAGSDGDPQRLRAVSRPRAYWLALFAASPRASGNPEECASGTESEFVSRRGDAEEIRSETG